MEPLIIDVCLTGNVPLKKDNPDVPLSPDEIIRDSNEVLKLGATYLHIHARDKQGKPTYKKEVFEKIISGIKKINDKAIICVTTSGRIFKNDKQRREVLTIKGSLKPDFASLTLGSFNFPKEESVNSPKTIQYLSQEMLRMKIYPEWEVFEPGMLNYGNYLVSHKMLAEPRWINIFLGSLGTSPLNSQTVSLFRSMLKPGWRFAITGVGRFQFKANILSLKMGGHIRVGLEDSFFMDQKKKEPATNPKLVKRIIEAARAMGREIADIDTARRLLLS